MFQEKNVENGQDQGLNGQEMGVKWNDVLVDCQKYPDMTCSKIELSWGWGSWESKNKTQDTNNVMCVWFAYHMSW
jgi:hypothetical protein